MIFFSIDNLFLYFCFRIQVSSPQIKVLSQYYLHIIIIINNSIQYSAC